MKTGAQEPFTASSRGGYKIGLSRESRKRSFRWTSWPTFVTEELPGPLPPRRHATVYHRYGRHRSFARLLRRLTRRHRHKSQTLLIASNLSSKMEAFRAFNLAHVLSNRSHYLQDPFAHLHAGIKILCRLRESVGSRQARFGPSLAGKSTPSHYPNNFSERPSRISAIYRLRWYIARPCRVSP